MMSQMLIIAQKQRGTGNLRQNDVQVPVPIDVGIRRPASDNLSAQVTSLLSWHKHKLGPLARSGVPEQLSSLAVLLARIHLVDLVFDVPIGMQHIQAAVEVVIKQQEPELQCQPASRSYTFPNRVVYKKGWIVLAHIYRGHFVGKIANHKAQVVVVPEISHINAHRAGCLAISTIGQTVLLPDLFKRAIAQV